MDAVRAAAWSYAGVGIYVCLQFIANITIARLLGPDAVGLFALTLVVCGSLRLISDIGIGTALIQVRDVGDSEIQGAFSALAVTSLLCAAGLCFFADLLSHLFGDVHLGALLRVVSATFFLYPIAVVSSSILVRRLDQKMAQIASISGYLIGYLGVGLSCALSGLGALSLAIGFVVQILVWTLVLYFAARPHLRFVFPNRDSRIFHSGSRALVTNLSNWAILNIDNIVVSRFFGATSLGHYTVAYNLMRTPVDHIVGTLQSVILPTASLVQDDRERVSRGYIASLDAVWIITLPCFLTIASLSNIIVTTLYGAGWEAAAPLMSAVAIGMPFLAISIVSSAVLWGSGGAERELRIQVYSTVLFSLVIYSLAHVSLAILAWGVPLVYSIRAVWLLRSASSLFNLPGSRLGCSLTAGSLLSLVVCPPLYAVNHLFALPLSSGILLSVCIAIAALLWMCGFAIVGFRTASPEFQLGARMIASSIQSRIARVTQRK